MNKTIAIILGALIGFGVLFASLYNSLVSRDVAVTSAWAQVENVLQRRLDLIPNLVSTVKGYAKHEKDIFEKLAEARAQYAGAKSVDEKIKATNALEGAIGRLLVIVENYPNLKANETFARLMDELSGSENRIAIERMRYNDTVRDLNTALRKFPYNLVAGFSGKFKEKQFFEAVPEASSVPKVDFESK